LWKHLELPLRPALLLALLAAACTDGSASKSSPLTCTATVSDTVATVIGVEWTAPEGTTSSVEFGETARYGLTSPTQSGPDVHADLVGVPADTDVHWHGVSTDGDSTWECSGVTHTGTAPDDLPEVTVTTDDDGQDDTSYVIGAFFSGAGGRGARAQLAAYRRDGTLVWYYDGDDGATAMDLHYALDGGGLLFNQFAGQMGGADGSIHEVSLAGEIVQTWAAPKAHHMFAELPDGTLAYQQIDTRSYTDPESGEADDWVGDAIAEIPPGGEAEVVYSVWDSLTPRANDRMDHSIYGGEDWTHGNNLVYSADTDSYVLSLGHADDVLTIDRASGTATTVWGVDGASATPQFDYQHDAHLLDDGHVLMFMTDDDGSGAVEYAPVDGGLEEVWRSTFGPKPFALGEARRLANGNTLVNGGAGESLREEKPDGTLVWEMETSGVAIFGQFQLVSDLYTGE
jgi:hypothetical protein